MRIKALDPHFSPRALIQPKYDLSISEHSPYTWVPVTLLMRAKLRLYSKCSLGMRTKPGWTGYLEFFLVKCSRCKEYFIDYPHGYKRYFWCPRCDQQYSAI